VGISSGATLAAIAQKLKDLPAGATVLGFNYDTGERYLSIEGFLPNWIFETSGCKAGFPCFASRAIIAESAW